MYYSINFSLILPDFLTEIIILACLDINITLA